MTQPSNASRQSPFKRLLTGLAGRRSEVHDSTYFRHAGFCPICEKASDFTAERAWFRDYLVCSGCNSIPRERALFKTLKDFYPNYRELSIHESSPGGRGASVKLLSDCPSYTSSHYFPTVEPGKIDPSTHYRCEDLGNLTFSDESFDIFITQDVLEHLLEPDKAFQEIARVLKPGGAHIFTVPLINKTKRTERRASRGPDGDLIYHVPPEYHGNPIDSSGSLVTMHWGYDIASRIQEVAGTPTIIIMIDNIDLGIRAEYIDVLVTLKME